MRVILFAWCPNAALYLEALCRAGCAPLLVVSGKGAPAEGPLSGICLRAGIPLEHWPDVNAPESVRRVREIDPDLVLVSGWPRIFRAQVRRASRLGFVNAHPSLLPEYRGRDPIFWAVVRGERTAGVTLHLMTDELDAGPILLQRAVAVPEGATFAVLSELVDRAGAALVPELVESVRQGALPPVRSAAGAGSYFPPVDAQSGRLDFTRSAGELERLVRACQGITRAHAYHRGMKLIALDARSLAVGTSEAPGTVVAISGAGVDVAAADASVLRISRWLFLERAHDAGSLAALLELARGARFD